MEEWKGEVMKTLWFVSAILFFATACFAATYTVTNPGDHPASATLRWAINSANTNPGMDVIAFNLAAPYTIQPTGQLPTILGQVQVDGRTQPGYAGIPRVCLDGSNNLGVGLEFQRWSNEVVALRISGWTTAGIWVNNATDSVIRACYVMSNAMDGIRLYNSRRGVVGGTSETDRNVVSANGGHGVYVFGNGSSNNTILGNYIGTTPNGTVSQGNDYSGIQINSCAGNTIGGAAEGARNIISGNYDGININSDAHNHTVLGNYIGTDASGSNAIPNTSSGVFLRGGSNTVGGASAEARNIISGNGSCGVYCWSADSISNKIWGNHIGTDASGMRRLPNLDGVCLNGAMGTSIGGTNSGQGNVISGNNVSGVHILSGAAGSRIQGNIVGLDAIGSSILSNKNYGFRIETSDNLIGGGSKTARNVISGNGIMQVWLSGAAAERNIVAGNFIGTDVTGSNALGAAEGIIISGPNNLVGGLTDDERNVISGHMNGYAVSISGAGATNNRVWGNFVGIDAGGARALTNNVGIGVSSSHNEIGCPGGGNVISANRFSGVSISGENAYGNLVRCNYIGLNAAGDGILSNGQYGIDLFQAPSNRVGLAPADGNVIAGCGLAGIRIYGSNAVNNTIVAARIGTDAAGSDALGCLRGIQLDGAWSNRIGGRLAGEGNVIAASGENGIHLQNGARGNVIQGNLIGTDITGLLALPNARAGVCVDASFGNLIGGATNYEGNIISGNLGSGVEILYDSASGNRVWGNRIGLNAVSNALGNGQHGVLIRDGANLNWIGGQADGTGNAIMHNGYNGVTVAPGSASNAIIRNAIAGNGWLGIDLGNDGVTANDKEDVDVGANLLQNYPEIIWATNTPVGIQVVAKLNSRPLRVYYIEYFGSMDCDVTGYGEGEVFLFGRDGYVTDGFGDVVFTNTFTSPTVPPNFLTMTATDQGTLDTSEFSRRFLMDFDEDGMGDGFEYINFGSMTGGEAEKDEDDDEVSNLDEFIAATDASDKDSWMGIVDIQNALTGKTVHVRSTSATRTYALQYPTPVELPNPSSWINAAMSVGNDGVLEIPHSVNYTTQFYRVSTQLP